MPAFRYVALAQDGREVKGGLDATDLAEARAQLRAMALLPLSLEIGALPLSGGTWLTNPMRRLWVRPAHKLFFLRQIALMVRSGHRIVQALEISAELVERDALSNAIRRMTRRIEGGAPFSEAIGQEGRLFPPIVSALIYAGEQSGTLDRALERTAEAMEQAVSLRKRLIAALTYPLIVLIVACFVIYGLLGFFVPRLTAFLESNRSDIHWSMQMLIDFTDWMGAYGLWILGGIGGFVFLVLLISTQPRGRLAVDRALIALPLFGRTLLLGEASRFGTIGAVLLQSGLRQVEVLRILARATENHAYKQLYQGAADRILGGSRMAEALHSPLMPKLANHMISVGEETGILDEVMEKTGRFYEESLRARVDQLIAMLVPAVTITLGVLVLIIYFSMFSTILNAVNSVR
ncbi:MAG: type II secretion system F family protein [Pseudomonadota bacterium]